jgi:hypothetical protein
MSQGMHLSARIIVVEDRMYQMMFMSQTLTVTSIWDWPGSAAPAPLSIDVWPGTSIGGTTFFTLQSYAQCASLAGREERAQTGQPIRLKTFTEVLTSTGEKARCVARVVCH